MMKTRRLPESNYMATWINGKTLRFAIDPSKPIEKLQYPEFQDIKITEKCFGNCNFCYMDSKTFDVHHKNIVNKIKTYYGQLTENQRPFQVAIAGGEPTLHPEFIKILKALHGLGIVPNYTTNGMFMDYKQKDIDELMNSTKKYCGGVAVSCHPHLKYYWENAANLFYFYKIQLNFHIIISDKESVDYFMKIYEEWAEKVDYFVLLPYGAQGRAEEKTIDWDYLVSKLPADRSKLAFGANFYPYLQKTPEVDVNLYEPEIMSSFLDMKDMKVYKSSFCLEEIK